MNTRSAQKTKFLLDLRATSWISSRLERRIRTQGDFGIFANSIIKSGDVLTVMTGAICNSRQLFEFSEVWRSRAIQIEDDLFQISVRLDEPADYVNHSCEPNAGIRGQIITVAMRDIEADEEITIDYAMIDGKGFDEFDCQCGSKKCRKKISGQDWMNPELWRRYEGYFSDYLARRISKLESSRS